jgi:hypothetical protein
MLLQLENLITPVAIFIGGIIIGFVVEKVILNKLYKIAQRTKWEGDDIIIASLRGWIIFWFALAGLNIAFISARIKPETMMYVQKIVMVLYVFSATIVLARIGVGFVNMYGKRAQGCFTIN